ncbi:unnamed protein product [Rotaria sp. Silwood1]|nr:unnamed protein product [Rotaria sp. Silwood1]
METHELEMTICQDRTTQETTSISNSPPSFSRQISLVNSCSSSTDNPFHQARAISEKMSEHVYKYLDSVVDAPLAIPKKYEDLIWFIQPKEVILELLMELGRRKSQSRTEAPFIPRYNSE